jgi:putative peptidoglycan lipid II flippase
VRRRSVGVGGAALLIAALTAVSTMLGFARDVVIAAVFGAGGDLDAYFVAQGLMNLVLGLLAGAMATAAVPVIARVAGQAGEHDQDDQVDQPADPRMRAARSISVALSVTVVVLGLASILMWLAAGPVVAVLAPGFDAEQAKLARTLTRVVLAATVLIAGTNLLAAAAQAHRRFFWAGMQGIPFNLVMIVAAAVFGPRYGVAALAVGFVAGSAVRLLCQLVPLRSLGLRLRPSFDLSDPGFRAMALLIPPLLIGSAVGNVNTLVDRAVGSIVGEGAISALSYAWRLVGLAQTLLVASLAAALYPAFGAAAGTSADQLRRLVTRGLTSVAVILAPVCVGLLVAAGPVVTIVYQRGSFSPADARLTAQAVVWYAPALLAMGWREVVVRASIAAGDSKGPVTVALVAMVVNVAGDLTLGLAWGIPGLALSTSLSLMLAAAANTWLLGHRHNLVVTRPLLLMALRVMAAATIAAGAAAGVLTLTRELGPWTAASSTAISVSLVFAGVLRLLRAPESEVLGDAVRLLARRR